MFMRFVLELCATWYIRLSLLLREKETKEAAFPGPLDLSIDGIFTWRRTAARQLHASAFADVYARCFSSVEELEQHLGVR